MIMERLFDSGYPFTILQQGGGRRRGAGGKPKKKKSSKKKDSKKIPTLAQFPKKIEIPNKGTRFVVPKTLTMKEILLGLPSSK
jgi:hypothetical protein